MSSTYSVIISKELRSDRLPNVVLAYLQAERYADTLQDGRVVQLEQWTGRERTKLVWYLVHETELIELICWQLPLCRNPPS